MEDFKNQKNKGADFDILGGEPDEEDIKRQRALCEELRAQLAKQLKDKMKLAQMRQTAQHWVSVFNIKRIIFVCLYVQAEEYEKIGEVLFDGIKETWNLTGCVKGKEDHGEFDWAYNHPQIVEGGSYWLFKLSRDQAYSKGDAEFKIVCSYFTSWNSSETDTSV